MTSPDGITWTPRTAAADNDWRSVTYGNGLFVAVSSTGIGNHIMTSPDGITWTSRTSAADNSWQSVTYGNGLFVAVSCGSGCADSADNNVMTSPDGITWTLRTSALDNWWYSVTYGNGLFVAVAMYCSGVSSSCIMTSPDGVIWTPRVITSTNSWFSVTYGNGLFVAVAYDGTSDCVITSPDGITWTYGTSIANNNWYSVAYGNGLFAAVAESGTGNRVMTSAFPSATSSANTNVLSFTTPTDTDIASALVLRSTSAITDTPTEGTSYATSSTIGASTVVCSYGVTASTTYSCTDSGLTNGTGYYYKFFMKDTTGNYSQGADLLPNPVSPGSTIVTLTTGTDTPSISLAPSGTATTSDTFTFKTSSGTDVIQSVTVTLASSTYNALSLVEITNNAGSVTYGSSTNPSSDTFTITLNNSTLTANTTPTQYRIRVTPKTHTNMPAVPGSTYYVTSYISNFKTTAASKQGNDLPTGTTTVVTIDNTSPSNFTTTLGTEWVQRTNPVVYTYAVTYGSSTFVAVGTNTVLTSYDGITWTSRTPASANSWRAVTFASSTFVAVSTDGTGNRVMTSSNGITWTSRSSAEDNSWTSITYGSSTFVAVSSDGTHRVMTSPDGITWTARTAAYANDWNAVTYGNGLFVAVSDFIFGSVSNRVMTSPDGITWTARTAAADGCWRSVVYGSSTFVALSGYSPSCNTYDVMTSSDGITWTGRAVSATTTNWQSLTYGNNQFVAVGLTGGTSQVMTSPDGVTWTNQSSIAKDWSSVAYGNNMFAAVSPNGTTGDIMTSSYGVTASSSNTQITFTLITPTDTDITNILALRKASSAITDTPTEGSSYATSSTIGASTVVCSFAVSASSTYTCTDSGLTNGTPYYYKFFTKDSSGNYSVGGDYPYNPISPGTFTVTLTTATDTPSVSLAPSGTATTSDTFTFQTSSGTDVIQSVIVTLATSTYNALSLVEITNNAGSIVYGSSTNPSSDTFTITLNNSTLTANTTLTQYRIRVTPKTHANMPSVPGSTYSVTSYISGWTGTSGAHSGNDTPSSSTTTVVTIDNASPSAPSGVYGTTDTFSTITIRYTIPSDNDTSGIVVLTKQGSSVTDAPTEGSSYSQGNTIGASTVACVSSSVTPGNTGSCSYSPSRGSTYYFKVFAKDSNGNYSSGTAPSSGYSIAIPAGAVRAEIETVTTATTTVGGGGNGGGDNTTGSSTNATTTNSTSTPPQGGGGGDVGLRYNGSNLTITPTIYDAFTSFFGSLLSGNPASAQAEVSTQAPPCSFSLFGICVMK
jgi:hypothetical protein